MSGPYVFDTEAIIAFLYREPGHETVATVLQQVFKGEITGFLAETNACEVLYLVARFEGNDGSPTDASLRVADRDIRTLERNGIEVVSVDWRLAATIKAEGRLSLADAYGVALAQSRDATLLAGADDDFTDLPVSVDIHRFREQGV